MPSNCLVFHTSGGILSSLAAFLFLIFLSTESSSSWVNIPILMSNCLLIILVIGSCVTFGGFPRRFSKCCFHSFILSCWFAAFNFALVVHFLLLTSFIVCRAILDCLSSTESLILSIWFCMYSVSSFSYMPANWYCAVFSFRAFVFVGFFLYLLEVVCRYARFSLTANVSHGTLYLVLGFVGIYFAAASRCALTKFSYSSFGVPFSVFSCSVSNLFLTFNTYLFLISLLLSYGPVIVFGGRCLCGIFCRLSRIFAVTIRWLEDTPSKEEYASQFIALFFHFLFIKT